MNTLVLHGSLSMQFGSQFRLDCRTAREAVHALCIQLKGFKETVRSGAWLVLREMNGTSMSLDMEGLDLPLHESTIHLMPAVEGASTGKAAGKIILGIGLIALNFIPGVGVALDATIFGTTGLTWLGLATGMGIGLALGGMAMLIAPTPKLTTSTPNDSASNTSRLFGNNVNPSGQNFPVPIAYGRVRIGAFPVASQIQTNEVNIGTGSVLDNGWTGAGLDGNVDYGNPPVLTLPSAPAIPTDSATLWLNSASNFQPNSLSTGTNPWTWHSAGATYAGGIWTLPSGEHIYVSGQATLVGMQVGDLLVGNAIPNQVWTGTQWVPTS